MGWLESRIQILEQRVESLYRRILDLFDRLRALQQRAQGSGGGDGGDSSTTVYFFSPTAGIAGAGGAPGTGSPGNLAGQAMYVLRGGAWHAGDTNATVYNGMVSPVVATKTCAALKNGDGTYSVISQSCT